MTRTVLYAVAAFFTTAPTLLLASPKVAVVNVPVVSERYVKTSDLEVQFDDLRRRLNQERDAMRERIDRAQRALQEEIKPGTEEFDRRRREIAMLEAELQWFLESEGQKVEQGLSISLRSIFDDIQAVVREIALEKGIDVVVAGDRLPADTPASPAQVRQHILLQKVLYWSPGVDLTDDVVARLNARYKASGGSRSTPGTPGEPGPPGER